MWLYRLSLTLGRLPGELAEVLTAADVAAYAAMVELEGPWWGEREAHAIRELCSVVAATAGVSIAAEQFRHSWTVGPRAAPEASADDQAGADQADQFTGAEGLQLFAAAYGLDVVREGG